jgi:plasmid stabilization system protein ParE
MTYQLIILPAIEQEIAEIFDEFHSTDRALSFLHDLNVVFERIVERPRQFPVIHTWVRRALLKHHDYSVFFELDAERMRVVIHAVLHQHRDPVLWPR